MSVLSVRGAIVANLVSSGAVKEFVRIIRVAKLTLIQAIVPSADKVVTQCDVHEEIDLLSTSELIFQLRIFRFLVCRSIISFSS